jgi:hypothetical protein
MDVIDIDDFKVKIIFFDFDGVLNTLKSGRMRKNYKVPNLGIGIYGFESDLIDNLNMLCDQLPFDWKFVISSSWKMYGFGTCLHALLEFGMYPKNLCRWTDQTRHNETRGAEIIDYTKRFNCPVEFVVIDDESFDLTGDQKELTDDIRIAISPRFVQTNSEEGLTVEKVNEILVLVNKFDKRDNL